MNLYDFSVTASGGKDSVDLSKYRGEVVLVVNTASKCGFTPQFDGLQKLYDEYQDQGFTIIGFPCNQFKEQDPGSDAEITEFCKVNYGVTFPMMSKIDVNGPDTDPLYVWLKDSAPGLLGSKKIKWNFTKFLVGKDGEVLHRYGPQETPASIDKDIQKALQG
ncbi:MAG: glutathione peroxidase [Actinobacteria bacterium]|nr:glutathione peroxidase [Actinomycetota bacterium]